MLRALIIALSLVATAADATPVEELVTEKARDTFGPEFPDEATFRITLQGGDVSDALMLSAFWMDRATGQFLANAVTEDGDIRRIQGLAILSVEVPVPVRRILPGEILRAEDLKTISLPHARIGGFAIVDADKLIGKEVRRILTQGRPVMTQSVIEPLVIQRGDKVAIKYDDGRLSLSAPGRAMDDAHRGQEIRIVNLVSNTLVTGVARAEGLVEIIR